MTNVAFRQPGASSSAGGDDFYAFVSGDRCGHYGAATRIAWEIERLATLSGWPTGSLLGSEAWLRRHFGVSRETLREAIRIVEGRGAARMRRGHAGGLILARPGTRRTAAALANHLRATGFTEDDLAQSVRGLDHLLAWTAIRSGIPIRSGRTEKSVRHALARAGGEPVLMLCVATLGRLATRPDAEQPVPRALVDALMRGDAPGAVDLLAAIPMISLAEEDESCPRALVRSPSIVARIVACAEDESDIGSEADLCEQFESSRSVVRQAIRVLQDLDMLHVRRGRGGGYALKAPSPIGVIRQVVPWLAAGHHCPISLIDVMWDLNAVNVRLAGEQLARLPRARRYILCDRIDAMLAREHEPRRFVRLQQALAEIAACPLVDTIARCIVSYQARCNDGPVPDRAGDIALAAEAAIVSALRGAEIDRAERTLRELQDEMRGWAIEQCDLPVAAE